MHTFPRAAILALLIPNIVCLAAGPRQHADTTGQKYRYETSDETQKSDFPFTGLYALGGIGSLPTRENLYPFLHPDEEKEPKLFQIQERLHNGKAISKSEREILGQALGKTLGLGKDNLVLARTEENREMANVYIPPFGSEHSGARWLVGAEFDKKTSATTIHLVADTMHVARTEFKGGILAIGFVGSFGEPLLLGKDGSGKVIATVSNVPWQVQRNTGPPVQYELLDTDGAPRKLVLEVPEKSAVENYKLTYFPPSGTPIEDKGKLFVRLE